MPRAANYQSAIRAGVVRLLVELTHGPATMPELVRSTGLAESTVRMWLVALRAGRLVHIESWEQTSVRNWRAVYGWNPERLFTDTPRPPKLTHAQRMARWRERKRLQLLGATVGKPV